MKYLSISRRNDKNDYWKYPFCISVCIPGKRIFKSNIRDIGTFWIFFCLFGHEWRIRIRYKNFEESN